MDHGAFDELTRAMAGGAGPRRSVMRLLTGGALGGLLARLGRDDAEAKKKHGKRHDDKKRSGDLHAAGKKHKKHKKKDKDKPRKPAPCGAEQFECPDGSCISLDQCCPGEKKCPDGRCTKRCCVGQNQCDDGSCLPGDECCPEERRCPDGFCLRRDYCCPGTKHCGNGCIAETECCPFDPSPLCTDCEEVVCDNGNWECQSTCQLQESTCCQGECLLPCSDGKVINPETCQCECPDGQRECPGGSCVAEDECCPGAKRCAGSCIPNTVCCGDDPQPHCDTCKAVVCDGGAWTCQGTVVQCQEGCCPEGYTCHPLGSCCTAGPPLFCTCPSGYHSEGGLCVPD